MNTLFEIKSLTKQNDWEQYKSDFQTPIEIAKYMRSLIPTGAKSVLEPTPGAGNIISQLSEYDVTAPEDFFLLPSRRFDCVIMNPPFSAKFAKLDNAPANMNKDGMRLGYFILTECMKLSDHVIALMPWFTISDSDVRLRHLKSWGLKSLTALPRKTFEYARIQTCVFEFEKGYEGETIFKIYDHVRLSSGRADDVRPKDPSDYIMDGLEEVNRLADLTNKTLSGLLNEIQKDWDDDTREMINNPEAYYATQKQSETKPETILSMEAMDVLKNCTVHENVIKLPAQQLDRKDYEQVKKKLELIGGKWKGGKVSGFVFKEDPTEMLEQIAGGKDRNLKKEFQFFATPDELANQLVEMCLGELPVQDEPYRILEPSAGQGSIVKAINRYTGGCDVFCYELMPLNQTFLNKISTCILLGSDFITHPLDQKFDAIIANPPFNKNQDIDHIRKMYSVLADGGCLVTIASKHWQHSGNKKESEFRNWLSEIEADVEEIPSGAFKESGTSISCVIIKIFK